jgi:hypothetical protein
VEFMRTGTADGAVVCCNRAELQAEALENAV